MIKIGVTPQSVEEALLIGELTIGKDFYELDVKNTFALTAGNNKKNKGILGNIFQDNVFDTPPNSKKEADLEHIGLEVKVLPVITRKDGTLRAKERMFANIINFETEGLVESMQESEFYEKNKLSIVICYEFLDKGDWLNNKIVKVFIHSLDDSDEAVQIEEDYNLILSKIKAGRAHLLSGKDTKFLEAATKGQGRGRDLRPQFGTDVFAKQRAFAFKTRYLNSLLND